MPTKEDEKTFTDEQFADYLSKTFVFALFLACGAVLAYVARFAKLGWSDSQEVWGQFGDFVGGVINPIVGLVTAFLVLMSVSIQRKELKASVQEMKAANASTSRMSFEQSLFAWLANYQLLLNNVKDGRGRTGREALVHWYESRFSGESAWLHSPEALMGLADLRVATPSEGFTQLMLEPEKLSHRTLLEQIFLEAQSEFTQISSTNRVGLDPIFRTLSRLFRWIDTSPLTTTEKWHYVSLVSAQLSWIEQVYMLYYALGSAPSWFGALANKYSLLHAVDTDDALIVMIASELTERPPLSFTGRLPAPKPWPLQRAAFEPELARANLGLEQEPN
ncbi:putative phage abortive infection protein [Variovorax sp. ZT4R33]|uniref:putative phage abortive infection protein n=1 Tax=Variovorax sp. ZT4R33 TaxID=3443743 RepID=UPI003F45968E